MISYFTKMYQAVPSLMPLQQALGGDVVTTRPSTRKAVSRQYPQAPVKLMRQWWPALYQGYRSLKQADLIVTGSPNNSLLKQFSGKKAMVFHGTFAPLSVVEAKAMAHFDYLCVLGPRMADIMQQAGLGEKTQWCGYLPFLEHPQKNLIAKQQLLEHLGLNPLQPLILYLPAGRPIGSWDLMAEKLLREIPRDYNLILRPHPSHSVTARHHDKAGFHKLNQLLKSHGNAHLDLTVQRLTSLYSHADLVISDGTSPAEESLYYNVPQLFVETALYGKAQAQAVLQAKNLPADHIAQVLKVYECGAEINPQTPDLARQIELSIRDTPDFAAARAWYFEYVFGERLQDVVSGNNKHAAQQALIERFRAFV